jgi:magnesium transporter
MKKVTSWAAIVAVPTGVTGFYGMNVPTQGSPSTAAWRRPSSTPFTWTCSGSSRLLCGRGVDRGGAQRAAPR